jgi:hypothetical protein
VLLSPQVCRYASEIIDAWKAPSDLWPKQAHRLDRDGEDRIRLNQNVSFVRIYSEAADPAPDDVPHVVGQIVQAVLIRLAPAPLTGAQRREAGERGDRAQGEVGAH